MDAGGLVTVRGSQTSFTIGRDRFEDLRISPTPTETFYYFFDKKRSRLITEFTLSDQPRVRYVCRVCLIKKEDKFTPRLALSIRDKRGQIASTSDPVVAPDAYEIKANVSLEECHTNFWELISFLESLREIDIPRKAFSLVSEDETRIVAALRARSKPSLLNIIRQLSSTEGVSLSEADVNDLLRRKDRLRQFESALKTQGAEDWWQDFFERNKWIFGYGLNYQILRHEEGQPYYGGTRMDGGGGQRGDTLASTEGDINFTVLVDIKTPKTPLLQGNQEIRSGAWSLSKQLTDALSQLVANVATWEQHGSAQPENRDRLEAKGIYTVQPKGIIVIGSLSEVKDVRSKRETFQRFRQSIHGIDIMTFDELYARARFIVENKA